MQSNSLTASKASTHTLGTALCRDGTALAYSLRSTGPDRPRIALIHSLGMDGSFWGPVAELLAPHLDVLSCDCRGHGASGKPAGPYSTDLFAADLADLLDHLGWATAHVAGASMGGSVALSFAANCPARTLGLGLIDTTAWYGEQAAKNWSERAAKARAEGLQALVGFQQTRWFCDAFRAHNPVLVQHCVDTFLRNDLAAFEATCQMLGSFDLRARLPQIAVKTVVAVGEEDYATPVAMAQALYQGIAGSSLEVIANARHLTPLECPPKVAAILLRLLEAQVWIPEFLTDRAPVRLEAPIAWPPTVRAVPGNDPAAGPLWLAEVAATSGGPVQRGDAVRIQIQGVAELRLRVE